MKGALNYLSELLYPPRCAMCGELLDPAKKRRCFCERCLGIWESEKKASCPQCRMTVNRCKCQPKYNRSRAADSFCSLTLYDTVNVKRLIHTFKTVSDPALTETAARDLTAAIFSRIKIDQSCLLAYPKRSREAISRFGFDHAELLCKKVGRYTGIPVFNGIKHRRTQQQKTLSASERGYNALRSYYIPEKHKNKLKGKHVIFIDDVVTTGATSVICSALCKAAGALSVSVFSLARTP